jgi:DNA-binding PadR family transcriptional regulator
VDVAELLPLPQAQFHILVALSECDSHGYAIMQHVEETSGGLVRMGPASLYGSLKKLDDLGLITELAPGTVPDVDQRRRYYSLTPLGREVCLAEADRLASLARRTRHNLRPRHA